MTSPVLEVPETPQIPLTPPFDLLTQETIKDVLQKQMILRGLSATELVEVSYQVDSSQVKQKRSAFDRLLKGRVTNPSLCNLEKIVKALGGQLYIHWNNHETSAIQDN
jgi:hypothetical protein